TRHAADAAVARAAAFHRFDSDDKEGGEDRWAEARRRSAEAHKRFDEAERELEAAFFEDAAAVREPMADVLWSHAELAAAEYDDARRAELLRQLERYDPG